MRSIKEACIFHSQTYTTMNGNLWLLELAGRLHPLLVHFPIGLIVIAALLELYSKWQKQPQFRAGINAMIYIGAFSALLAMIAGLILANSGEYGGASIIRHRNGGIITAVLSLITAIILWKKINVKWYRLSLFLTVLSLTISGHWGAMLTHGSDYITSVLPSSTNNRDDASIFLKTLSTEKEAENLSTKTLDRLNLEVRAIFAHNCYKCHSEEKTKGELILETKEAVMKGGESGPIIMAGNARESELYKRINLPHDHDDVMPQKGKKLKKHEIALIQKWIDLGAHWTEGEVKTFREAPLALEMPKLPSSDLKHPIDRLLDDYFTQKNASWPDLVDDRTFIRRVYLDIIGLLPDGQTVQAFEAAQAGNKREKLIQQLLSQDHNYSQHWLSFWNDLLRNDYSGTGFITGGRKQITGWLYQSLLANKPYDKMLRELINPDENSEGFIKGIRWRGVVNSSQRTEMQAAQNISQSLLGINLKCASCHDSFVSNLTLEEAYGFANIFADSTLEIHRCDQPTGKMAKTVFLYPELGEVQADSIKERLHQLANVMVQPSNGRIYRTIVNRLWAQLMGRGIVSPVDEMDNIPWSQEMLDWLAADLIEHNYDLKHTLMQIMTSRAYQLPSIAYESIDEVRDQNFVFKGPLRRRLSAEQFADAMSQFLAPVYHAVAYHPTAPKIPAQWIWTREIEVDRDVLPKPGKRFFRYTFSIADKNSLIDAQTLISVDHSFKLYINENLIGEGNDWRTVNKYGVLSHLQTGDNIIAIEGENEGQISNPAGILFTLRMIRADSTEISIYSNRNWKTTKEVEDESWKSLKFDDSEWEKVRNQRNSHWGNLLDFNFESQDESLPFARASLTYLDPFQKALGRPTRENVATNRDDRATLLQALELTNGDFFTEVLLRGAQHWQSTYEAEPQLMIEQLYLKAFGRKPSRKELQTAQEILGEPVSTEGIQDLLWTMVLLPEFQLVY